jgi:carbohydrate-selective porin OprB
MRLPLMRSAPSWHLRPNRFLVGESLLSSLPDGPVRKTYDGILGDWGGLREKLDDAGVGLTVAYGNEFAANVAGGARKDATAVGQLVLGTDLDMDKIAGIHGGSFHGKITYRHGPNLGTRLVSKPFSWCRKSGDAARPGA